MEWEELHARQQLLNMTREELNNVDYDLKRWPCQCKKCTRGTRVRDYGISPWYYWPCKKKWVRLDETWLYCGKHWKFYKRLLKSFDIRTIDNKMLDFTWQPIDRLTDIKFTKTNKIKE